MDKNKTLKIGGLITGLFLMALIITPGMANSFIASITGTEYSCDEAPYSSKCYCDEPTIKILSQHNTGDELITTWFCFDPASQFWYPTCSGSDCFCVNRDRVNDWDVNVKEYFESQGTLTYDTQEECINLGLPQMIIPEDNTGIGKIIIDRPSEVGWYITTLWAEVICEEGDAKAVGSYTTTIPEDYGDIKYWKVRDQPTGATCKVIEQTLRNATISCEAECKVVGDYGAQFGVQHLYSEPAVYDKDIECVVYYNDRDFGDGELIRFGGSQICCERESRFMDCTSDGWIRKEGVGCAGGILTTWLSYSLQTSDGVTHICR